MELMNVRRQILSNPYIDASRDVFPAYALSGSRTQYGVTFRYNQDKSLTISGKNTGSTTAFTSPARAKGLLLPGIYTKPATDEHRIMIYVQYVDNNSNWITVPGGGASSSSFEITQEVYDNYDIVVRVGVLINTTLSNPVLYHPYIYKVGG